MQTRALLPIIGLVTMVAVSTAAQAGDTARSIELAQGEQRMVCSAGLNSGYRIDFGRNRNRRICVTFRWMRGVPTDGAPPAGHCRWDGRAPTRAEARIRRFCQTLTKDFRVERRGGGVRYKVAGCALPRPDRRSGISLLHLCPPDAAALPSDPRGPVEPITRRPAACAAESAQPNTSHS